MKLSLVSNLRLSVTKNPRITSNSQMIDVRTKMIPKISLSTGRRGLASLYWSSNWKISYKDERLLNLALKILNYRPRVLLVPKRVQHPSSSFLQQFSFLSLSYFPQTSNFYSDNFRSSLVFLIYADDRSFGLSRKFLIKSKGSEKRPTPPNIMRRIHPAKEQIAIVYTNIEASKVMFRDDFCPTSAVAIEAVSALSESMLWETIVTGSYVCRKNTQETKSAIATSPSYTNEQKKALRSLLMSDQSLSVSQRNIAQGSNTTASPRLMKSTMLQKTCMFIPASTKMLLNPDMLELATSKGSSSAWTQTITIPITTSTLQQTALPQPLSSGCIQRIIWQMVVAKTSSDTMMMMTRRRVSMAMWQLLTIRIQITGDYGRFGSLLRMGVVSRSRPQWLQYTSYRMT